MTAESLPEGLPHDAGLMAAVEDGDVLAMLEAQRRIMAVSLITAAENTRPQYNQALNKLHELIAAEQERLAAANEAGQEAPRGDDADEAFDPATV